jgi:hypothetical protein
MYRVLCNFQNKLNMSSKMCSQISLDMIYKVAIEVKVKIWILAHVMIGFSNPRKLKFELPFKPSFKQTFIQNKGYRCSNSLQLSCWPFIKFLHKILRKNQSTCIDPTFSLFSLFSLPPLPCFPYQGLFIFLPLLQTPFIRISSYNCFTKLPLEREEILQVY